MNRRRFLHAIGAAGCGAFCCRAWSAAAQTPRAPVVVGGRRVRTVDMHSHVYVDDVYPLVKDRKEIDPALAGLTRSPMAIDQASIERRLQEMDRQRIAVHVLSVHPSQFLYFLEADLAARVVRMQNEKIARLCAAHRDRFAGFGNVSLQHPDLAAAQIEHTVAELGFRGVIVGANVNGDELVNPRFEPFWKKAESLGAIVFIHPQGFADTGRRLAGAGALENNIGFPLDTTIALAHMIFEGFLDRYAGIRILAAHGGGFLASYIGRFDNCRDRQAPCQRMQRKPSEYLRGPQLYFDSLVYSPDNLRYIVTAAGASQIVIGTDFGFPIASSTPVDTVLQTAGLTPDQQAAILGGNAEKLLKLA